MENNSEHERKFEKVCEILDAHQHDAHQLIAILQEVQEEYRYLPEEIMAFVATSLKISPAKVYGVATFYSHFTLNPKGKYVIKVCDGTACHVKKSTAILEALQKKLNLADARRTTPDMMFTVETVSCLGACGLSPAIVVNEDVHGLMTPDSAIKLIDEIVKREAECNA